MMLNRNGIALVQPRSAPPESTSLESPSYRVMPSAAVRPRLTPTLRVGFLTPNLLMGGVEHWLLGLLKNNSGQLSWSVAVTNPWAIEPEMRREAEAFAEVVTGEPAIAALVASADVIVAWGVYGLAELLQGITGPVVQVSHGCGIWTESFLAANRVVTTHSVAVSRAAASAFGHDRVTIIPNGVDPRRCEPLRPRDVVRREWGLLPHEIAVGFVGRISPEKNPLATSQAVRALGPGYRAVYVGKGYGEDMRPAARNLTPDAIFVPPMQQVGDALHALDCLIMASPAEGFSLALVESLMANLPVVATPVGVVPDLQRDHNLALMTVPIDPTPDQLATAVRAAISPTNRALVERAQAVVLANYTAETMAQRWLEYLQTISMRRSGNDRTSSRASPLKPADT